MQVLTPARRQRGFTLMEAIVAMTITGIIAGMVAVFIAKPVEGYMDSVRRAGLTDVADLALKRMAIDIRGAVPNTVRVAGGGTLVEFIPARTGGRYCADTDSGCNALEFGGGDTAFDVVSPDLTVAAGDQLVVYNTGQEGLSAYAGDNRRAITTAAGAATALAFSGGGLAYGSPSQRFQLIPAGGPVTYACQGGELRRHTGYGYQASQPTSGLGTGALLADDVSACQFSYSAVSARNGLLVLAVTITREGESVSLHHEIHVDNMP